MSGKPLAFVLSGPRGSDVAAITLIPLWSGVYGLKVVPNETGPALGPGDWRAILSSALERLAPLQAQELQFRLAEGTGAPAAAEALRGLGFIHRHDRIEYETPLGELPGEEGTPLAWESLEPEGPWSLEQVAALLRRACEGDPDFDPQEDALANLRGYLAAADLTRGPECVQVGRLGSEPAAVIIAQVNPDNGWSRITYMAVLPERRGRGLGRWVQRHGFEMMRRQGGAVYHAGTVVENAPMLRLLSEHGCRERRRVQEWTRRLEPEPRGVGDP